MTPLGLYLHLPYCKSKCRYCDFYSLTDRSTAAALAERSADWLRRFAGHYLRPADTLYFGGGTPNLLPPALLAALKEAAEAAFPLINGAEITCEYNPGEGFAASPADLAAMGFNRLSVGMQSAVEGELKALGRLHTAAEVKETVRRARAAGFANLSLDCMWGVPGQTVQSALDSLEFALSLEPTHLSAYLLKIEPNTPFGRLGDRLQLPDDETVCAIYERCCERLEGAGYRRYEISNFALPGYESRHNCKYWHCDETLGIGPAAHSFLAGRRFYFPPSVHDYLAGRSPVDDGPGGDFTEYAMLQLRLREGLQFAECRRRYGEGFPPPELVRRAETLARRELVTVDETGVRLTVQGNLVSNAILAELL